jgi:hypothetical protein
MRREGAVIVKYWLEGCVKIHPLDPPMTQTLLCHFSYGTYMYVWNTIHNHKVAAPIRKP